ncbi:MAG: ATP synthase subunit I [Armatimonadota bacterium]|nr:MAG: ATP synthase subunit I [Armatimonadota bacterium]
MADTELGPGLFRGIYVTAGITLATLAAVCWAVWGRRAAAGMAAGGLVSIGVLVSWQWLAAWVVADAGSKVKRRLVLAWPLKYAVIGGILYVLLRWDVVNVFALIAGLGLIQAVIFGRVLLGARPLLTPSPKDGD